MRWALILSKPGIIAWSRIEVGEEMNAGPAVALEVEMELLDLGAVLNLMSYEEQDEVVFGG